MDKGARIIIQEMLRCADNGDTDIVIAINDFIRRLYSRGLH